MRLVSPGEFISLYCFKHTRRIQGGLPEPQSETTNHCINDACVQTKRNIPSTFALSIATVGFEFCTQRRLIDAAQKLGRQVWPVMIGRGRSGELPRIRLAF